MRKQCEQLAPAFLKKHGELIAAFRPDDRLQRMLTANQMDRSIWIPLI